MNNTPLHKEDKVSSNDISGTYYLQKLSYSIHKKNKEKILKASYNFKSPHGWVWTSLYLSFDKKGYSRKKAMEWLNKRDVYIDDPEVGVQTIHKWIKNNEDTFPIPTKVKVEMNEAGYPIIIQEIW